MSGGRGRLDLPRSHRGGFLPLAVGALAIGAGFAVILLLLLGPGSRTPGTSPGQPGDQARDSPTSARTADPISKRPAPAVPPPPPSATPNNVCAVGEPDFRGSGPAAGRLHGGGLTMPLPDHLDEGDPHRMPYAFDVALVDDRGDATWAGVGALRIEEPYHTPEQATATVTACLAQAYADLQVEQASFVALPGVRQAHERTGSVTATGAEHDFRVLVADTGAPESLAVYVRVSRPGTSAAAALTDAEQHLAGHR